MKEILHKAVRIIKKGGLVAFPTETVYGLGANALDKKAVRKIFKVKRRPLDNPIIVHIAEIEDLSLLAKNIPEEAKILTKKFWPGPLTLVLFKKKIVPEEVTAGTNTVAIRMPDNEIALRLIRSSGVPIAAPSANLAGKPSSTIAQHVFEDLGDEIDLIFDGGPTKIGVESTVVDLTVQSPQILSPGGISFEELKRVIKNIQPHPSLLSEELKGKVYPVRFASQLFNGVKSPGMKYRHYASKASLILVEGNLEKRVKNFKNLIDFYKKQKKIVGVMISRETKKFLTLLKARRQRWNYRKNRPLITGLKGSNVILVIGSRKNLKGISRNLFKTLRKFDKIKVDVILAETFSEKGIGFALMHRLKKATKKGN